MGTRYDEEDGELAEATETWKMGLSFEEIFATLISSDTKRGQLVLMARELDRLMRLHTTLTPEAPMISCRNLRVLKGTLTEL